MEYQHNSYHPLDKSTVVIGGGGGAASMTAAYVESVRNSGEVCEIEPNIWTVIVGTFDRGGSSGILQEKLGIEHGVGDGGNNIKAGILDPVVQKLFNDRFDRQNPNDTPEIRSKKLYELLYSGGENALRPFYSNDFVSLSKGAIFAADAIKRDLHGHSYRNLAIAGLIKQRDYSVSEAFKITARGIGSLVNVVAVSDEPMELTMRDGDQIILGEHAIDTHFIQNPDDVEVTLVPDGHMSTEARAATEASDLLIIAPGSPFTSILPLISLAEVRNALYTQMSNGGQRIGVLNIANNPHDTAGWTASTYYQAYRKYLDKVELDALVVHKDTSDHAAHRDTVDTGSIMTEPGLRVIAADLAGTPSEQDKLDMVNRGEKHNPLPTFDAIKLAIAA